MRIIRYQDPQGETHHAAETGDGHGFRIDGDIFGDFEVTGESAEVSKLLAPVVPSVLICIGLNYRRHAEEGNLPIPEFPVVFFKSPMAVQNPGDPIQLPRRLKSTEVDYECELAVVIGKTAHNVKREDALDYVLGYTCANDVSARDWQVKWGGSQWCRGKTFDTFAPLGPCLVLKDEIPDPNKLRIKTTLSGNVTQDWSTDDMILDAPKPSLETMLSGDVMQDWNTDDMIFDVPALIEFLSSDTTLPAGTVILTGTPHGIGAARKPPVFLKAGDVVSIEIEKIGTLTNPVVA
jgi:2-keto-4-pentenoate hydratase/2-oxohepta-3-ene-1,7-dioic acid hydratase in catechol pathway